MVQAVGLEQIETRHLTEQRLLTVGPHYVFLLRENRLFLLIFTKTKKLNISGTFVNCSQVARAESYFLAPLNRISCSLSR